jgi:hypothetical protein
MAGIQADEGKLYLCAIKDVYSNRIVGYSIDSRMKASLAVSALHNAIALRDPDGTVIHSDSETVRTGIPGVLDSHSDGRGRMLVPGAPGVLDPHSDRQPLSFPGSVSPREYPVRRYASPPE